LQSFPYVADAVSLRFWPLILDAGGTAIRLTPKNTIYQSGEEKAYAHSNETFLTHKVDYR
jgi:hypothetical protein